MLQGAYPKKESGVQTLTVMSLDYASDHPLAAVKSVVVSDGPLQTRLQTSGMNRCNPFGRHPASCPTFWLDSRHSGTESPIRRLVPGAPGFGS